MSFRISLLVILGLLSQAFPLLSESVLSLEQGTKGWAICRKDSQGRVDALEYLPNETKPKHVNVLHHRLGKDAIVVDMEAGQVVMDHYAPDDSVPEKLLSLRCRSRSSPPDRGFLPVSVWCGNPLGRPREQLYSLWRRGGESLLKVETYNNGNWKLDYQFKVGLRELSELENMMIVKTKRSLVLVVYFENESVKVWDLRRQRQTLVEISEVSQQTIAWPWERTRSPWGVDIEWCARVDEDGKPWVTYPREGKIYGLSLHWKHPIREKESRDHRVMLRLYQSKVAKRELLGDVVYKGELSMTLGESESVSAMLSQQMLYQPSSHLLIELRSKSGRWLDQYSVSLGAKPMWLDSDEPELLTLSERVKREAEQWGVEVLDRNVSLNCEGIFPSEGIDASLMTSFFDHQPLVIIPDFSWIAFMEQWPKAKEASLVFHGGIKGMGAKDALSKPYDTYLWDEHAEHYGFYHMNALAILPEHEIEVSCLGQNGQRAQNLELSWHGADGIKLDVKMANHNNLLRWENLSQLWPELSRQKKVFTSFYQGGQRWQFEVYSENGDSPREAIVKNIVAGHRVTILLIHLPWSIQDSVPMSAPKVMWNEGCRILSFNENFSTLNFKSWQRGAWVNQAKIFDYQANTALPFPSLYQEGELWVLSGQTDLGNHLPIHLSERKENLRSFSQDSRGDIWALGQDTTSRQLLSLWRGPQDRGDLSYESSFMSDVEEVLCHPAKDMVCLLKSNGESVILKNNSGKWQAEGTGILAKEPETRVLLFDPFSQVSYVVGAEGSNVLLYDMQGVSRSEWTRTGLNAKRVWRNPTNSAQMYVLDERSGRSWVHVLKTQNESLEHKSSYLTPLPWAFRPEWRASVDEFEMLWISKPYESRVEGFELDHPRTASKSKKVQMNPQRLYPIMAEGRKLWILRAKGIEEIHVH